LLAAVAPWCYTIGAVVGPTAGVWHWLRQRTSWRVPWLLFAVGILSTVLAVAMVAKKTREAAYWESGGRGLWEAFDPVAGFAYVERLVVDRLLLTNLGWRRLPAPAAVALVLFAGAIAACVVALRRRPKLAAALPGLLLIALGYGVAIPFRTWESYVSICNWTRYQMLPQLGLALAFALVCSTLFPCWFGPADRRRAFAFAAIATCWTILQKYGLPF
jgi:hypothetical protein